MNKTVNINLAGIFFHIDEDAYAKLQRYLEAIKRSFTDSQGQSEIISDIEARIAELFSERLKHEKQVIGNKEVEEIITIMGQPEDYLVDDDIFEDEPKTSHTSSRARSSSRKLFRDTDNSYVGGVSSGLAHYFGIEAIWIRLVWILLIFGAGTGVLLYILLWILLPEALTTTDKIMMTGKPVNISNIEKKIKDGFDSVSQTVSDTVKSIDVNKQSEKIKSGSQSFFDAIGNIFMFFFKVFSKFIGIILIIVGLSSLIALAVFCISLGTIGFMDVPVFEFFESSISTSIPIWLLATMTFLIAGIPFFFIFYLGLKVLINNLKSIGSIAKFTLLGLWVMSLIGMTFLGVREASEHASNATITKKEQLYIKSGDTLRLTMVNNEIYTKSSRFYSHRDSYRIFYNENDEKTIYSSDIRLIVRSTKDSLATINIERSADGRNYQLAKERASKIEYNYVLKGNELQLDSYLVTNAENKFRDQEIIIVLYLPEGTVLYAHENTYPAHSNSSYYNDILDHEMEEHYLQIIDDGVICLDCPDEDYEVKIDIHNNNSSLKIDSNGIEIKTTNSSLEINDEGIKGESEDVKVNIGENGIEITTDKE